MSAPIVLRYSATTNTWVCVICTTVFRSSAV